MHMLISDGVYIGRDVPHGTGHIRVRFQQILYLSYGAENRRMVSSLIFGADVLQREIRERAHEIH